MKKTQALLMALALLPIAAFSINKLTPVYMFGFACSFNDSTVYLSEIQRVDSTWLNTKNNFLYSRDSYSSQLRDHLKENGAEFPTCLVVYAEKRKDIEKKYLKFKKRYATKGNYIVKYVDENTFRFKGITPDTPEATYTKDELKAAVKQEKADLKAARKAALKKAKTDKREKKKAKERAMFEAKQRAKELKKGRDSQ